MIPQGIEIVQNAIAADGDGDYEKALNLYRDALQRFTIGLKYEKNAARKKLILERTQGYMDRAEELAEYVKKQNELDNNSGGGGGTASKQKGDGDDPAADDADKKKLRGALAGAIVTEKPNIKWDDVAGLESAKESLKEVPFVVVVWKSCEELQLFSKKLSPYQLITPYVANMFRQSSCQHYSHSYLRVNVNHSRVFYFMDHLVLVNHS